MYQKLLSKQELIVIAKKWRQPGNRGASIANRKGHVRETRQGTWRAMVCVDNHKFDKTHKTKKAADRWVRIQLGHTGIDTRYSYNGTQSY